MHLINSTNNKFRDANPATLDSGTAIPAASMNTFQSELANIVTGYGLSLDPNNDGQVKSALDGHFAPIASPNLSGVPLTSAPTTTSPDNQIATVGFVKSEVEAGELKFTPVQQGGGSGQGTNKVFIGWGSDGKGLRCTIDASDQGVFAFQGWVGTNFLNLSNGGNVTGLLTYKGGEVATTGNITAAEADVKSWVSSNFGTTSWITQNYAALSWVQSQGYATQTWVQDQNYGTESWVNSQGFATQGWVGSNYYSIPTFNNNFVSSDNAIHIAGSKKILTFQVTVTATSQYVTFPEAFSGIPTSINITETVADLDCGAQDFATGGFTLKCWPGTMNQAVSIIAIGPV